MRFWREFQKFKKTMISCYKNMNGWNGQMKWNKQIPHFNKIIKTGLLRICINNMRKPSKRKFLKLGNYFNFWKTNSILVKIFCRITECTKVIKRNLFYKKNKKNKTPKTNLKSANLTKKNRSFLLFLTSFKIWITSYTRKILICKKKSINWKRIRQFVKTGSQK
jgi:hypothetical protein